MINSKLTHIRVIFWKKKRKKKKTTTTTVTHEMDTKPGHWDHPTIQVASFKKKINYFLSSHPLQSEHTSSLERQTYLDWM
jgi:hypothetical protein